MAQQVLIIGLGQFGMSLARTLSEKGAEVLAIDPKKDLIEEASDFVVEAIVMDGTDEKELANLQPAKRDLVVCAIGDDSKEASIICTALLRQMGAPYIIAKASDKVHQRILKLVGANLIINPEQEYGKRFANRILYRHIIADTPLGEDLTLTEINVQPYMQGKSLVELELPKRFGAMVVAVREHKNNRLVQPKAHELLKKEDTLVIVSPEAVIPKLIQGKNT